MARRVSWVRGGRPGSPEGDSESEAVANTGSEWKVLENAGYEPIPVDVGAYYASPPGEAVDARHYPWGWEQADYADEGWNAVIAGVGRRSGRTQPRGTDFTGQAGGWQLVPRSIPPMEERPVRFAGIEGKTITGIQDVFRLDGGERRRLQTLWFRTFRYVQVEIETADELLRIHDLHGIFTAYPFELRARFESDLPWLADMWEMNWRGARLCAWETYFDTPYYEQLQSVGDTRIQALISLYMTGDDRLVRAPRGCNGAPGADSVVAIR